MPIRVLWGVSIFIALCACGKPPSTEPELETDRDSLGFGQEFGSGVFLGTSKQESLLIRNVGGAPLEIQRVDYAGPQQFSMEVPPKMTVDPGGHTFVRFFFTPEEAKVYTAIVTIHSNATNAPEKIIELSGRGVDPNASDAGTDAGM